MSQAFESNDPYLTEPYEEDQVLHLFVRRPGGGPYRERLQLCEK
jgi:hypothetical protein